MLFAVMKDRRGDFFGELFVPATVNSVEKDGVLEESLTEEILTTAFREFCVIVYCAYFAFIKY